MKRITIIGGGASGTLLALNLLKHKGDERLEVNLVEKRPHIGRGVAFSTDEDMHLLNVPAGKMGAYADDVEHFHRWLNENGLEYPGTAFVPRRIFGEYLREQLEDANQAKAENVALNIFDDEAVDIQLENGKANVQLASGDHLFSEKVALAFGNFLPPHPTVPDQEFTNSPMYYQDPWTPDVFESIKQDNAVLIIGTGLSMVDVTMQLYKLRHKGLINAISTRGQLPAVHKLGFTYPSFHGEIKGATRVTDILKTVRVHAKKADANGSDWRAVIDSLRPVTQQIWLDLPLAEKKYFMQHLSRYWNVARHRMAPEAALIIDELRGTGQLQILQGRLQKITWEEDIGFDVRYSTIGLDQYVQADAIINCIGSESRFDQLDSRLVKNLLTVGVIRCDDLRFGLDATPDGHLKAADGQPSDMLYTLGTALKGVLWESTAIPEIRVQARDLAQKTYLGIMSDSFCKRVIDSFEARRDKTAMRIVGDDEHVYSFGETLSSIRSVAYRLSVEGVGHGDRVALIGENHPSWAVAYLATLFNGSVCVPMDPNGEIETLTNFLENSEAKLAFIGAEVAEKFSQIEERLGRKVPAVVWSSNGRVNSNGFQPFDDWAATEVAEEQVPTASGDDIALLIYTSGTTGTPKGVPLTHGNIIAELDGINRVLQLNDKEKILSLLPLFHAYLQIVNLWVATTYGCEVGYLKEMTPAELGNAMKEFKPTILTTVPRLWYLFHKKIFDAVEAKPASVRTVFSALLTTNGFLRDTVGVNLGPKLFGQVHESFGGKLRIAISAGSRFDEDVAKDFHKLGFTILQGYGLTETSGAATATYEDDNRIGSVGKPMFNAEIKIADPDAHGVGEVLIKGEMVFSGYYRNPTATAEAFTEDGWFRSGDLGKLDEDGHLYIVGRAKDVIVLPSGKNVHPEDLEIHYLKSPEVEELAVIGVADESTGRAGAEKLIAVVVPNFEYLKAAKLPNSKEAIRYALDNLGRELPEYQRVRDYIVRTEPLPRTATRKIKRFELKKQIESGEFSSEGLTEKKIWKIGPGETELLETSLGKTIANAIRSQAKDVELIHPDMNLEIDLGLDSLARAEFFAGLEQAFKTQFSAEQIAESLTVRDVIELAGSTKFGQEIATGSGSTAISADLNWGKIVREAEDDMPEVRAALRDRTAFVAFAWVVYRIFNLFCRGFMRLEVTGVDNLKKAAESGPTFLVCPNHQSFLDPFVLTSNYPYSVFRRIFHVGASMFFQSRIMRFVSRMLRVVPIDQDTQLMKAMKAGAIGLKRGMILNIYPEGERAFDGKLHEFKKGAAILATELDLPIVPVALDGLQNVWARRSWKIRPAKVKIKIGEPILPSALEETEGGDRYERLTRHLRSKIKTMVAELRD